MKATLALIAALAAALTITAAASSAVRGPTPTAGGGLHICVTFARYVGLPFFTTC